ncbi:MAG: methyltransferase domain-containing protein [Ignavibacteriales bacterium]|nr:methyltransferase domain-containing protein [Ignavibacteriales bacterium]
MGYLKRKWRQAICRIQYPGTRKPSRSLCKILKSQNEVDECTRFLHYCGYHSHFISLKDWDLATIIPEINEGNFLDMGSSDSYILKNLALKKIPGELHGIDLRPPDRPVHGVHYTVGDLVRTSYPDRYFRNVACLSVIEHHVDFNRFGQESSRLLESGGKLFVTFDYWEPKINSNVKLYGLEWQPLDKSAVENLITVCKSCDLFPVQEMDWTTEQAVVHKDNFSPDPCASYTFGMVTFEKRESRQG